MSKYYKKTLIKELNKYFILSLIQPKNSSLYYIDKDKYHKCLNCNKEGKLVLSHSFSQKWFENDDVIFSIDYSLNEYFSDEKKISVFFKNNRDCFHKNNNNKKERDNKYKSFEKYQNSTAFLGNYENQNTFKVDFLINNFVFSGFLLLCEKCENKFSEKKCNLDFDENTKLNNDLIYGNIKRFLLFYKYMEIKINSVKNMSETIHKKIESIMKIKSKKNINKKMSKLMFNLISESIEATSEGKPNTFLKKIFNEEKLNSLLSKNGIKEEAELKIFLEKNIHSFFFDIDHTLLINIKKTIKDSDMILDKTFQKLNGKITDIEKKFENNKLQHLEYNISKNFPYFGFSLLENNDCTYFYLSIPKFEKFYIFFREEDDGSIPRLKIINEENIINSFIIESSFFNSLGSYDKNSFCEILKI